MNEGISVISEFFNTQSAAGDVAGALSDTAIWFKISMWLIMIIGAISMAIWIARIAADILLIATRGMMSEKVTGHITKFGTGKSENYTNVKTYLGNNLLEIILVIVLITLLMGGYLFRLIALAISGIGALGQRLFNLDIGGKLSALDAQAFSEQLGVQRSASLRNQYDEQYAAVSQYSAELYDMAKNGSVSDDPNFNKVKSLYTQSIVKAEAISAELTGRENVVSEFKLGEGYFTKHLRSSGSGVCNESFLVDNIVQTFSVGQAEASISCTG